MPPTDTLDTVAAEYVSKREFTEFRREIRSEFQHILEKLDEVRKPADLKGIYQALIATVMIIITIGTLAMTPVWKTVGALQVQSKDTLVRALEDAHWRGIIDERLRTTAGIAASLQENRTDVSDTIDDDIRERVLLNGFSREDAKRLEAEISRIQDRLTQMDRHGTSAFQDGN